MWKSRLKGSVNLVVSVLHPPKSQPHLTQDVSTRHYDRYDYFDDKLVGLEAWSSKLKELIGYVPPALSVVPSAETLPFPDIKSPQSLRASLK